MTDLRTRLAVALMNCIDPDSGLDLEAVVDVLLSLPGIAIVETDTDG